VSDDIDARARTTLRSFLDRADRVLAGSIANRDDLDKLGSSFGVRVTADAAGRRSTRVLRAIPDEELIVAAASRIRPLLLKNESIHFDKVTGAIGRLTMEAGEADRTSVSELKESWRSVATATRWTILVGNKLAGREWPSMSDREIAFCWLYGDVVHADDDKRAAVAHLQPDDLLFAGLALVRDVIVHVKRTCQIIRDFERRSVLALS
jgi:hypothetical protein